MDSLVDHIKGLQTPVSWEEALTAMVFSLIAAVIAYLMYQAFYGTAHIGAGVHRTFIIGGPAITMLFLGIQTSIPLSLGLLGALSFVRFRTPVKDPAEIGFLLLLVASSIGAATENYLIVMILYAIVFVSLGIQWFTRNRFSIFSRGHLMIVVDQPSFGGFESKLTAFLRSRVGGLKLESMSALDDRVTLHYQYRRRGGLDWAAFTTELNQIDTNARVEMFVG